MTTQGNQWGTNGPLGVADGVADVVSSVDRNKTDRWQMLQHICHLTKPQVKARFWPPRWQIVKPSLSVIGGRCGKTPLVFHPYTRRE